MLSISPPGENSKQNAEIHAVVTVTPTPEAQHAAADLTRILRDRGLSVAARGLLAALLIDHGDGAALTPAALDAELGDLPGSAARRILQELADAGLLVREQRAALTGRFAYTLALYATPQQPTATVAPFTSKTPARRHAWQQQPRAAGRFSAGSQPAAPAEPDPGPVVTIGVTYQDNPIPQLPPPPAPAEEPPALATAPEPPAAPLTLKELAARLPRNHTASPAAAALIAALAADGWVGDDSKTPAQPLGAYTRTLTRYVDALGADGPDAAERAMETADAQGSHGAAYVIGILAKWHAAGRIEEEARTRRKWLGTQTAADLRAMYSLDAYFPAADLGDEETDADAASEEETEAADLTAADSEAAQMFYQEPAPAEEPAAPPPLTATLATASEETAAADPAALTVAPEPEPAPAEEPPALTPRQQMFANLAGMGFGGADVDLRYGDNLIADAAVAIVAAGEPMTWDFLRYACKRLEEDRRHAQAQRLAPWHGQQPAGSPGHRQQPASSRRNGLDYSRTIATAQAHVDRQPAGAH